MIEEILGTISEYMNEKIKMSKGMLALFTVSAFIIGILTGLAAAKLSSSRKVVVKTSAEDDFDADEYVRNLNFDEE